MASISRMGDFPWQSSSAWIWSKEGQHLDRCGLWFAELVQQNVQRAKDAESIGERLGQVMDQGILTGRWERKIGRSCLGSGGVWEGLGGRKRNLKSPGDLGKVDRGLVGTSE